ncbi:MAG: 30S ribosomal protein S1 [Eggerthellaceae bacterium]|nr:30S ribosomal protein S1 [Eggerthellaceae bacterium]
MTEIKNTSVIEFEDISDEQMDQMIDGTLTEFDEGDLVDGIVVKIEHDEVLVDIGFKSEGVIPSRELSIRKDADPSEIVNLGDKVEALVLQKEDKDGRLVLSKKRAEYERAWIQVEDKFKAAEIVVGEVIEVVKGGLILDIGLRGFLPASLVDLRRVKDLDMYMGTEVEARVIEMDRNRNNVVLSRRVLLEEGRKNERAEILEKLTKGMRLKGAVSSIVDFGAFVDLGGIDGLVHISELSWNHVNHPSEVVKVGDEVEVEVLDVDLQRERISLGLKQTTEDPWVRLVEAYPLGAIIDGKVTKVVPFGTFIELGESIEGLVHISEMSLKHIESPAQVVHVDDEVKVKVMEVNPERRRISLSMKAAAEELGFDIPIDESYVPEEKPAKKRVEAEEAFEEFEAAEAGAEEVAEEAAQAVEEATEEVAEEVAEAAADAVEEAAEEAVEAVEEAVEEAAEEAVEEAEKAVEEAVEEVAEEKTEE